MADVWTNMFENETRSFEIAKLTDQIENYLPRFTLLVNGQESNQLYDLEQLRKSITRNVRIINIIISIL
jgi:hypothetical protein